MRQWELDYGSLRADHSMLFGNIGDGQTTYTPRQPVDSFAQVFNDLQSNLGIPQEGEINNCL